MSKLPIIKKVVLSVILGIESFIVVFFIKDFIQTQNYFSFTPVFTIKLVLAIVVCLYTLAIGLGTSDRWSDGLIFGGSISIGIFFILITYDTFYALFVGLGSFLVSSISFYRSFRYNKNLIKTLPKMSLRYATRGILVIFSISAATIFLLESSGATNTLNIGERIAEVIEKPVKSLVENQIPTELPDLPVPLEGLNLTSIFSAESVDIKGIIESQVNNFLEPYKKLFSPVMAILIFAIIQFYSMIAYYIYFLTINPLFSLLKKIGLIKIEKIQVEKEQLTL